VRFPPGAAPVTCVSACTPVPSVVASPDLFYLLRSENVNEAIVRNEAEPPPPTPLLGVEVYTQEVHTQVAAQPGD
jgi:hypothetical protein